MLVVLTLLLLGVGSQAAPQPQAQDACVYVDEDVCQTEKQEVCEDGTEWECNTATRYVEEGSNVVQCDPTTKTICTPKTRYEPVEYLDDECTTTTEEVCKTNYDTVVKKFIAKECSTTYHRECTLVKGASGANNGVITREELRCTCDVCTIVLEECNCDEYNVCEKCPTEKCHEGPIQHTRSGCKNEVCKTVEIHTKDASPPNQHCVEKPTEYCSDVEQEKTEVVPRKDCNHIPTKNCVQVKKTKQKEIIYQECLEKTEDGCKTVHVYITKPENFEECKAVTKEICSFKPKRVCKTIKTQVCGGH